MEVARPGRRAPFRCPRRHIFCHLQRQWAPFEASERHTCAPEPRERTLWEASDILRGKVASLPLSAAHQKGTLLASQYDKNMDGAILFSSPVLRPPAVLKDRYSADFREGGAGNKAVACSVAAVFRSSSFSSPFFPFLYNSLFSRLRPVIPLVFLLAASPFESRATLQHRFSFSTFSSAGAALLEGALQYFSSSRIFQRVGKQLNYIGRLVRRFDP